MAVVSRIARIRITNTALSGYREFLATADVQDTAEGGSVVVTVTNTTSGAGPPAAPATSFTLRYVDDAGSIIKTVALDLVAASQTDTFYFTSTGLVGGSARHGTVEIKIQATTVGGLAPYDVESDGSPNSPPAGFNTTNGLDRGWIRGTTTLVEDISNTSLGGAPNPPASYGTTPDSLYVRLTLGSQSYIASTWAVALSHGSVSGNTNSATATTRDVTFSQVVDDRFPAASTTVSLTATPSNATLTGEPHTVASSTTDDTIAVDPRVHGRRPGGTLGFFFMKNRASFDTDYDETSDQMLTSDVGQAAIRVVNARDEGVNGLSVTLTADPQNPGSTNTVSTSTSTLDSQAGWTGLIDVCVSGKPGGFWDLAADITAPASIDSDTHFTSRTGQISVIANNPDLVVLSGIGAAAASLAGSHFVPGEDMIVAAAMRSISSGTYATVDVSPSPYCRIFRLNPALGRGEYLIASPTGNDATDWAAAASTAAAQHTMTALAGDSNVYAVTFAASITRGWKPYNIIAIPILYSGGTPVHSTPTVDIVSADHRHDQSPNTGGGSDMGLLMMKLRESFSAIDKKINDRVKEVEGRIVNVAPLEDRLEQLEQKKTDLTPIMDEVRKLDVTGLIARIQEKQAELDEDLDAILALVARK